MRTGFAVLALAILATGACKRARHQEVLQRLVTEVVLPMYPQVAAESRRLSAAVDELIARPGPETQARAQEAWRAAAVAWKTAYVFRNGPAVETSALIRAAFWPPRMELLEKAVAGAQEIDQRFIDEVGVSSKGLFAIEPLLFGPPLESPRRRSLLQALARDLAANAARLEQSGVAWARAGEFAKAGQASVNRLFNQMVESVETVGVQRLAMLKDARPGGRIDLEGQRGGVSQKLVVAVLAGTERLYVGAGGGGVGDLVKATAPAIDEHVRAAFRGALTAVQAIGVALETAAIQNPAAIAAAASACKELELALKVDAASALGATLTFTSGDGD